MKIELPQFRPNARERSWVKNELNTARFIQVLWKAAGRRIHDPRFISMLVGCGWVNKGKDMQSTREWRNRRIADYLGVRYESTDQLAEDISAAFPRLNRPKSLLQIDTGITHYYQPLRTATLEFVERHAERIGAAFKRVSSTRRSHSERIREAVEMLAKLGPIRTLRCEVSPLNGLTPALSCLDPKMASPIMNAKTKRLLGAIGKGYDADGAVALSRLIGHHGIGNSFELDVYAATANFKSTRVRRARISPQSKFRDVGLKSEIDGLAQIAASRVRICKRHNVLTNRLRDYLMWRYTFQEDQFDGFVPDWKPGRGLLIEAKTASDGPIGRTQIRQAIGQLFDYRYKFFARERSRLDLAVLLPGKPSADVQTLLSSLNIRVMWFRGGKLEGTVKL